MSQAARKDPDVPVTAGAGASPPPVKTLYCSFCFNSQHEVKMLISGPAGVFICSECVGLCNECLAGHFPDPAKFPSVKALPTDRLLEHLRSVEETVKDKGDQLQTIVDLLRSRRVSWAQIGAALGISRQSAWERFT